VQIALRGEPVHEQPVGDLGGTVVIRGPTAATITRGVPCGLGSGLNIGVIRVCR
jgi:hypothetical protein